MRKTSSILNSLPPKILHLREPRGDICHSRHCRRQCKVLASGVNFSRKQHVRSHNQHKKLSLLIYLCFFSQNCWTSLCLTKKCPNYWYSLIFAHKSSLKRSQITNFTGVIKFLAWKSSCVDFLTNIMSFFALHELKIFYWICWVV